MSQDNLYTFEELKDFTNNFTDRTIINISAFVETKTNREYSVIKRKMLYDLKNALFQNNIAIFDIQRFLNEQWTKTKDDPYTKKLSEDINNFLIETWSKVTEKNRLVVYKWKEEMKEFE
jgi:hypothetical protein